MVLAVVKFLNDPEQSGWGIIEAPLDEMPPELVPHYIDDIFVTEHANGTFNYGREYVVQGEITPAPPAYQE